MKVRRILSLALWTSLAALADAAEPGDDLQGPWRGSFEDTTLGTVAIEINLWRLGPSVLTGVIRYEDGLCIKRLVQVPGPRMPEAGDQQPTWFEDRGDPPDSRCGIFEASSRIAVGRGKDKWIGFAQRTLDLARIAMGSGALLSEGLLEQRPNTPEMEQAARAEFRKNPPAGLPAAASTTTAALAAAPAQTQDRSQASPPPRDRLAGNWAGTASRPTGGTAPVELQIWRDDDRLSGLALYPSSRCVGVLTQLNQAGAVVKFVEDAPLPGTICPSSSTVTVSPGPDTSTLQWSTSGPPGSMAAASGTFKRQAASEAMMAALRQRGVAPTAPVVAKAAPAVAAPAPATDTVAKPAGNSTLSALLGEPSRVPNTLDPIAWLGKFAAVDAEALGIANLTLYFYEEPANVKKTVDLAVEIAERERFTVPGLDALVAAAVQLERDYGGDAGRGQPVNALANRRNSVLQLMDAALVRRDPDAARRYRGLSDYVRSTPFLRSAVRLSSLQAQHVLALNRTGALLDQIQRNDNGDKGLAARLAMVTTEQLEMIIRSTTYEKAVASYRYYDNARRGVGALHLLQLGLDATLKSIGDMKMCFVTSEPVDAPHCASGGLSCTRPVMNCPKGG